MKRIIIICEGQTEQEFIKATMQHYFASKGIYLQTPLIKASRGGIVNWNKLKQEVETHLKTDKTAIVTTLIDYYGLYTKHSFPKIRSLSMIFAIISVFMLVWLRIV